MSIGEAESFRYYWQDGWKPGSPSWLGPKNPHWPRAYRVRYWEEGWREVIFGSEDAYLDRLLSLGFDGVYLDRVDGFDYWGPKTRNVRPSRYWYGNASAGSVGDAKSKSSRFKPPCTITSFTVIVRESGISLEPSS